MYSSESRSGWDLILKKSLSTADKECDLHIVSFIYRYEDENEQNDWKCQEDCNRETVSPLVLMLSWASKPHTECGHHEVAISSSHEYKKRAWTWSPLSSSLSLGTEVNDAGSRDWAPECYRVLEPESLPSVFLLVSAVTPQQLFLLSKYQKIW